nr:hypothetical protein [Actinomadura sp. J1-007]
MAMTRAPRRRACWTTASPTAPAPPCTSTVSPSRSRATVSRAWCTVANATGMVAAPARLVPSGTGKTAPAWVVSEDASAPDANPATRSPAARPATPSPTAVTVPANSKPTPSWVRPPSMASAGSSPVACMMSR